VFFFYLFTYFKKENKLLPEEKKQKQNKAQRMWVRVPFFPGQEVSYLT